MDRFRGTPLTLRPNSEQPSKQHAGVSRRRFLKTTTGAVALGVLARKISWSQTRPIKIGYIGPQTGRLAAFGESDNFVVSEFRKRAAGGLSIGGSVRPVEVLYRDTQSNSNRAVEVVSALIKNDKIDLMLAAGTSDTVNPAADQCELNGVPMISTDTPWQAFFFGRGGKPDKGFDWTYHFFWGTEILSEVYADIFDLLPTNKVVGGLWANNLEGNIFSDKKTGFPPVFEAHGYKVIDPGRFQYEDTEFSAQISALKKANAEILTAIIPPPTLTAFWSQAHQQGYKPKIATIGMALLFPAGVNALGPLGKNLTVDIWWSPNHPFKSGLTGQTSAQLCEAYENTVKKQWTQPLGFRHALFEMAADVLKRTKNADSPASIMEAIRSTNYDSVVGHLQWTGNPVKNVCTTPEVGGQWVPGKKWMYDLVVVSNKRYPMIPVQRKLAPL